MATINISDDTKEKFKSIKLKESAKQNKNISEDEFQIILLNNFEEE